MTAGTSEERVDLGARIARLMLEAGLVSRDDWEKRVARSGGGKHKNLSEVLRQDAFSLSTFHDLFFKAELIPFKKSEEGGSALGRRLSFTLDTPVAEMIEMLGRLEPPTRQVIGLLERAGVAEKGSLATAVKQARKLKEKPYPWLFRHEVLTSEMIQGFFESESNPLPAACALALSAGILAHNDLIDETALAELFKTIPTEALDSDAEWEKVLVRARKAIGLSSSELLDKIAEGLYLEEIDDALTPDPALMDLFPFGFVQRQTFVPLARDDAFFTVATDDPLDLPLACLLRFVTGRWPRMRFAPTEELRDAIQRHGQGEGASGAGGAGGASADVSSASSSAASSASSASVPATSSSTSKAAAKASAPAATPPVAAALAQAAAAPAPPRAATRESRSPEVPVDSLSAVQLVSSMIESAIDLGATDIHLEPRRENMVVRFRIDGALNRILTIPRNLTGPVASRIKVLANMDVTERRRPQDGHITLDVDARHFDFRIATLPTPYGEKIAVRILDSSRVMTGLGDTGMNERQLATLARLVHKPHGIVLVTGPTGSGKTSTLYAALQELNQEDKQLVTIEDPIEYQLEGINQVQVDPSADLTFSEGLRAILRQDPNVIMVGEIRDPDTAKTAIRAALTGHLVFSTLHTNTAVGAFTALSNLGATPYLTGSAVIGVVAQRLVRKLCVACRALRPVAEAMARQLGVEPSPKLQWYGPVGCGKCIGSGYSGRIGIFEIVEMTDTLRRAVLHDETPQRLLEIADAEGRMSMREAGLEKVIAGVTSPEEVIGKVMLDG